MKAFMVLVLAAFSISAFAAQNPKACNFKDYQLLNAALDGQEIDGKVFEIIDPALAADLSGQLKQEIGGPACEKILPDGTTMGIPGQTIEDYQVGNYVVSLVSDPINKIYKVFVAKK